MIFGQTYFLITGIWHYINMYLYHIYGRCVIKTVHSESSLVLNQSNMGFYFLNSSIAYKNVTHMFMKGKQFSAQVKIDSFVIYWIMNIAHIKCTKKWKFCSLNFHCFAQKIHPWKTHQEHKYLQKKNSSFNFRTLQDLPIKSELSIHLKTFSYIFNILRSS